MFDGGLVVGFEFLPVGLRVVVSPLLLAKRRGLHFDWQCRFRPVCPFLAEPTVVRPSTVEIAALL